MARDSSIGWTNHTFSPWWGCQRVSPACEHCYAETWAKRTGHAVWGGDSSPRRFFGDRHWDEPLKWDRDAARDGTRPRVFCMSMGDLFERRDDLVAPRERLLGHGGLIDRTPHLIWMLLTKRPENIVDMVPDAWIQDSWPSDVWMGVTAEDQRRFDERWPWLAATGAPVKFLSCEPLLEPIDFHGAMPQWVICGGESGAGARELDIEAARFVAHQAGAAGAKLYVKQLGTVLAKRTLPMWKLDQKGEALGSLPSDLRSREWPE